jgi:putative transposase
MAIQTVHRTYRASIQNQHQVRDDLDALGFAASKLWNVGRWTAQRIWDACGQIPDANPLMAYLKSHERYADLHSQSSQRVLQELGEAFTGWYGHRGNGNETANPPGYRKHGDNHPRSTVTFKQAGFKHDATHGYLRLSKGQNLKEHRSDFVLCSYETRPDVDLADDSVSVTQIRAVWTGGGWELHIVCTVETEIPDAPGVGTAGVDLGICNIAAVSFGDETLLYPGGALKADKHYFKRVEYECEGEHGPSNTARWAKRTLKRRQHHHLHVLSADIISQCVERNVGRLFVGDLSGIRAEDNGDGRNWGRHGNKRLHGWAFAKLTDMIEYKGEAVGIDVVVDSERDTSKTCAVCGHKDGSQRVHRGLYHCEQCGRTANADCTGAENCRQTLLPNPDAFDRLDRDNGCLAQPAVRLFDCSEGTFAPREQVTACKP